MSLKFLSFVALVAVLSGCTCTRPTRKTGPGTDALRKFQERAARYHAVVSVPTFETSTNEILATFTNTLDAGNAAPFLMQEMKRHSKQQSKQHDRRIIMLG